MLNDDLRKRIASFAVLEDWSDECGQCSHQRLLHKGGSCRRKEREPPDGVNKIWSDFRRQAKPMGSTLKADFPKDVEQSVLFDGLHKLMTQISGQMTRT